jgi:hypothetical protein
MIYAHFDTPGLTRPVFLSPASPMLFVYLEPQSPEVRLEYTYLHPDELPGVGGVGWISHDGDISRTGALTLWGPVHAVRLRISSTGGVTMKIEPFHLKEPKNDANLV